VLCAGDVIGLDLLPNEVLAPEPTGAAQLPADGIDLREAVNQYTRALIEASLARCGGVQRRAAQLLRVRPSTFHEMVRRLGIATEEDQAGT
jgi:sigma-54 dependent transcriptional regulator, flagellar regulatory protein